MLSPICESEEHLNNHSTSPTGSVITSDPIDPFGIGPVYQQNENCRNISTSCFHPKTFSVDNRFTQGLYSEMIQFPGVSDTVPRSISLKQLLITGTPLINNNRTSSPNVFTPSSTNFPWRLPTKKRHRLVQKDGEYNISLANVPKQKLKYFA